MDKKPNTNSGVCDKCKKEVASGPNAESVAEAVARHKKKVHASFHKK